MLGEQVGKERPAYYMYVFPNPVKSYIYIETNDPRAASIQIYDMEGRLVLSHSIEQEKQLTIDLSSLSSGTYIYKVIGQAAVITTNKFNITH